MKKWLFSLLLLLILLTIKGLPKDPAAPIATSTSTQKQQQHTETNSDERLKQAYQNQQSNVQIAGSGRVKKILADDNKGSRHQRFILQLASGQTLLVAHNIDLAPKIEGLQKGDTVVFYGVYEYSEQGGVIHWMHHDPRREHTNGWLKHNNRLYH